MRRRKNEIEEVAESILRLFQYLEMLRQGIQEALKSTQQSQLSSGTRQPPKRVVRTPRLQVELMKIDDDIRELEEELRRCKDDKCRKKVLEEIRKLQRKKRLILGGA